MEIGNRFNAFIEIENIVFFIRAMQVITIQAKTHKYYLNTQFFFK